MQKQKFCKDLVIGEAFEKEPFVLQSVGASVKGLIRAVLSDRSGTVQCNIPESLAKEVSLEEHLGDVFMVSAAVLADKRVPLLVVKSISLCTDNFLPAELFSGISQEKKEEFINAVKSFLREN